MTVAEMKQETGIPLSKYVTGLENKLIEISDSWHINAADKEAFYLKVHEILTRKIVQPAGDDIMADRTTIVM